MENQHPKSDVVRLLQITDLHCYADDARALEWSKLPVYPNQSLQRLVTHLNAHYLNYEGLVITGDIVQEETAASYQRVRELLQNLPLPMYVLPGNHDIPTLLQAHLLIEGKIHDQDQQVFNNWHSLFLNTHLANHPYGHLNAAELTHLNSLLQQIPAEHYAIIFMHHHPVPIGSPWMDTMGLQQSAEFWSILEHYPQVRAVVFGHIHSEFATQRGTVAVYGTPATCVQVTHTDENLDFDHTRPAWRELILYPNGQIETHVRYL